MRPSHEGSPAIDDAPSLLDLQLEVRRLSDELQTLRLQVATIIETERFRDVILQRHGTISLPPPAGSKLEARDFVENADGFHILEYDGQGVAYRWTGPGHFTRARMYIDRSVPTFVLLKLTSLGKNTEKDRITVDVEGTVYPMRRLGGAGITLVAGPVHTRDSEGVTDLFFNIPVTFSPKEGGVQDTRSLGVAIMNIEIRPHL